MLFIDLILITLLIILLDVLDLNIKGKKGQVGIYTNVDSFHASTCMLACITELQIRGSI